MFEIDSLGPHYARYTFILRLRTSLVACRCIMHAHPG